MPRSKRAKLIHLSKVEKKGKELTLKTFANVQDCVSKYPYIYVFSVDNMRNTALKDVRTQLSDSRLFFGKTKVMAKALGSDPSTAPALGTHLLNPYLRGSVGILFSSRPPTDIENYFSNFRPLDFARAGTRATRSFTIPAGTVYSRAGEVAEEDDVPLPHGIEPELRKLGVPSRLVKGRVELDNDYEVCKEGEMLGSQQTTLLKMFGVATAEFKVGLRACWIAADGRVEVMDEGDVDDMDVDDGGVELGKKKRNHDHAPVVSVE